MSTKKLQIVTPIVTSVNGQVGDVTLNSIEYTPQSLTDAQKSQARDNIGAVDSSHNHSASNITSGTLPVT